MPCTAAVDRFTTFGWKFIFILNQTFFDNNKNKKSPKIYFKHVNFKKLHEIRKINLKRTSEHRIIPIQSPIQSLYLLAHLIHIHAYFCKRQKIEFWKWQENCQSLRRSHGLQPRPNMRSSCNSIKYHKKIKKLCLSNLNFSIQINTKIWEQ